MKSTSPFARTLRIGAAIALPMAALAGCSTVSSLSPFTSNVPYSQDIQPTMTKPATPEVPAFKPAPPPVPPPPAPAAARVPPPADAAPAAAPPPAQSAVSPPAAPRLADLAPPPAPSAPSAADAPAPAPAAASPAAAQVAEAGSPPPFTERTAPASAQSDAADADDQGPSLPAKDLTFEDNGKYPNLAQVPARPPNMPTFLEAAALEKSLEADRAAAKAPRPDSPPDPSVDSAASPAAAPAPATAPAAAELASRPEDASPCLSGQLAGSQPAAVLRFQPGSAALTSDDLAVLADAMPTVRGAKGTIRVFGHGDTGTSSSMTERFDLATARAGAVAQALAGYGIPVPRIAVGVACTDASMAGASVQLYAES